MPEVSWVRLLAAANVFTLFSPLNSFISSVRQDALSKQGYVQIEQAVSPSSCLVRTNGSFAWYDSITSYSISDNLF